MGKFRSKLKRHSKGKNWSRGHSSTANPENQKHRDRARSRYFRANLSLAPDLNDNSQLTMKSVMRHEAQQALISHNKSEPTVNDVAESLKSFNFEADNMTESQGMTISHKTFHTFATNYTQCTNQSFSKLLNGFRGDSDDHKEMLAILAAAAEIINERNGTQSSTEYFLILIETINATREDKEIGCVLTLLGLGIKSVPQAVLRKEFSNTCKVMIELLGRFVDSDNQSVVKNIIGILSVLLRAQEYALWSLSSTIKILNTILSFCTHSKPKIRKSAQHAVQSVILGSCFMKSESENSIAFHPGGNIVTKYCISQFSPENISKNQTIILHVLGMLRTIVSGLKGDDIKLICEKLLSMMTASNVLIRTNCFQTLHALFSSMSKNVGAVLIGKLLTAIFDYQPDRSDVRQTLAWLTVLKQGHVYLSSLDPSLAVNSAVKLIEICCKELWVSDRIEITNNTTLTIKEILEECVHPIGENKISIARNCAAVKKIIKLVSKCLTTPFGQIAKDVILTMGILFKCAGKFLAEDLFEALKIISDRYDDQTILRAQIEHSIILAIASMGPENVLNVIPIQENGNFILERSWILPLLRESITASSFEYFTNKILPLASNCNQKWNKYKKENNIALSHTYELLCCQLWGLFPGFCRSPTDPQNFKLIAKILGTILTDHPDLRAPVLDGLKELIENGDDDMKTELAKFSKNFMPRLFNVYTAKPSGSYEGEIHDKCLEVIKVYLKITPENILDELFERGMEQLKTTRPGTFLGDSVFDIVEILAMFQSRPKLKLFYEKYITVILKQKQNPEIVAVEELRKRKQQKKCYSILEEILLSDNVGCVDFVRSNLISMEKVFVSTHTTTIIGARVARVKCLYTYFLKHETLDVTREIVNKAITEAIFVLHEFPKSNNIAQKLLQHIGDLYLKELKINDMIDILIAGFTGDQNLIGNTILSLKIIVSHMSGHITVSTLEFVLDQILAFLVSKNRKHVEPAISFMVTFVKVLPSPIVGTHLEKICRSFSAMAPDTKRFCRTQYGYVLKRLCKRFGAVEIQRLVPGNDEVTHKRLKRIRKLLNREKRLKKSDNSKDDDDNEDDDDTEMESKSRTIDEILADSDSDSEFEEDDNVKKSQQPSLKKRRKDQMYIQEMPESIVDLADLNSIGKLTSSKPDKTPKLAISDKIKAKDPNRGFKTADDGRLIISEDFDRNDDESDEENDVSMNVDGGGLESKKRGVADGNDSGDDSENEVLVGPTSNKKSLDSRSVGSRKTTASSKYVTGGKGIHRNTGALSVKSGTTNATSRKLKIAGSEYKSKKASGDVKRKGQIDPYAYIPLQRSNLNKRKTLKHQSEFKSIVKGARKGAAAGSKKKIKKAFMMMKKN